MQGPPFHSWETGFNGDLLGTVLHPLSFKAFTTQMVGIAGLIRREGVLGRRVEGIFLGSQNLGEPIKSERPAHSTCVSALNLDWIFWWHKRVSASCHWGGPILPLCYLHVFRLPASSWLLLCLKNRQPEQPRQTGHLSQLRVRVPPIPGLPRATDAAVPERS